MDILKLNQEMKRAGYTLERLSEESGIAMDVLRAILSEEVKSPSYESLRAIENVLSRRKPADHIKESGAEYAVSEGKYTIEDYYALPDDQRVELIDGAFYVMTAPSLNHQNVLAELIMSIRSFIKEKNGRCKAFFAPVDVQLDCDDKTMVQPDLLIVCDRDKLKGHCVFGAPDFVAEVLSKSTRKKDMNLKLRKYKNAGVREYWMIDLEKEKVITYFFERNAIPQIYGMNDAVPVLIFAGELVIDFGEISQSMEEIPDLL